jgi:formate dehydrogenase major subunit
LLVRDNHLLRIEGDWHAPVNEGLLCKVGRFLPVNEERERILTPLIRNGPNRGPLRAATWTEALAFVSDKLKSLIGKNRHGVAALASTRLSTEALYLFRQIFAGQMGSEMVTSIEEGITTALSGRVAQAVGQPFEGNLGALKAADCIVAVGVNLIGDHHQVAGFFIKRALPQETKLIVIDPFDNDMHALADYALRPRKGQDYDLLQGITTSIVALGLAKGEPTHLYDLAQCDSEAVSQTTGVPAETISDVSRLIASARRPAFVYGKGITRGDSSMVLKALLDLARLVGALDDKHSAVISTKGQANSLAAQQYELDKIFRVNGHQAIYLALGDDYPSRRLIRRLERAPFIVVQASYVSPLTAMADVVLPTEIWAEQEGYYLNLEGRLQQVHKCLLPPEEVRSNVNILQAIAAQLDLTLDNNWRSELGKRVPTNPIFQKETSK